jgi:hypothetical protein
MIPKTCSFPGCTKPGTERHHIIYGSEDINDKNYQRHYYCRKNKKGNNSQWHSGITVPLCHEHHLSITKYNHRMWVINRYQPLSCHQRQKFYDLWLRGEYPPGVKP